MAKDKYTAVWVSHSSISDFLSCPRAYYLKNVYKDPATGHKLTVMSPPLALGQAVHEVIESLSVLPTDSRFKEPLITKLEQVWQKVTGKLGGFKDKDQERHYKDRGQAMLKTVMDNPGPLVNLAVKINMDLPYFWLSEPDNIILCGKVDWLEYLPQADSVHIIDFKTSKTEENPQSLQLPIYHLLVHHCQHHPVAKASYWYLERGSSLTTKTLPDLDQAQNKILKIAKQIKLARQLNRFICPHSGCRACQPLEAIIKGEAEFVGTDSINRDVYIISETSSIDATTTAKIL
mgnify:CR=1 FL=1